MKIETTKNDSNATITVSGRLDTVTSPELEKELQSLAQIDSLVIDCADLEYISSAGLRVFLSAHKEFSKKGGLTITNVSEAVMDIFEVTGFDQILNLK